MLIHHFGSRGGLLAAVVESVERDQNNQLGELPEDAAAAIRATWRRTSVPSLWPIERLFFECYARGAARRAAIRSIGAEAGRADTRGGGHASGRRRRRRGAGRGPTRIGGDQRAAARPRGDRRPQGHRSSARTLRVDGRGPVRGTSGSGRSRNIIAIYHSETTFAFALEDRVRRGPSWRRRNSPSRESPANRVPPLPPRTEKIRPQSTQRCTELKSLRPRKHENNRRTSSEPDPARQPVAPIAGVPSP